MTINLNDEEASLICDALETEITMNGKQSTSMNLLINVKNGY